MTTQAALSLQAFMVPPRERPSTSCMPRMKRMIPPATWKEATVIPRVSKITKLKTRKRYMRTPATPMAIHAWRATYSLPLSFVISRKSGTERSGSRMTKRVKAL
jgi:hypothetical protein